MSWFRTYAALAGLTGPLLLAACGGDAHTPPPAAVTVPADEGLRLQTFQAASAVIGQPDFVSDSTPPASAQSLFDPEGPPAFGPNGELFIADTSNHRVLRYSPPLPTAKATADLVLGQPDFTSATPHTTRDGLKTPRGVAILGTRLAVSDGNQRVLLWNGLPTASGAPADVVVGQPDFTANAPACNARTFGRFPHAGFTPDGKLVVADEFNSRLLIWNRVPTTNGAPADLVLGQSGFDRCAYDDDDQDGLFDNQASARTLFYPTGVWTDGQRLVVTDAFNHRVLIWTRFPTTSFQPADLVLGQSDFVHHMPNDDDQDGQEDATPSARTLNLPSAVDSNGEQLVVADYSNNRVLIWNRFPTANFQPADRVLGQSDFSHSQYNDDNQDGQVDATPSARTASGPTGVRVQGKRLYVVMDGHGGSRVLVFESR